MERRWGWRIWIWRRSRRRRGSGECDWVQHYQHRSHSRRIRLRNYLSRRGTHTRYIQNIIQNHIEYSITDYFFFLFLFFLLNINNFIFKIISNFYKWRFLLYGHLKDKSFLFLVVFKDKPDLKPNGIDKPGIGKVRHEYFFLIFLRGVKQNIFLCRQYIHNQNIPLCSDKDCSLYCTILFNHCYLLLSSSCYLYVSYLLYLSYLIHIAYMYCVFYDVYNLILDAIYFS